MRLIENPHYNLKQARLEQLERMSFTLELNGVELSALAQLARKVGGMPDTTYRKYTQPLSDLFEQHEFLFNAGCDAYFKPSMITANPLPGQHDH